jgi:hypothetical protein
LVDWLLDLRIAAFDPKMDPFLRNEAVAAAGD